MAAWLLGVFVLVLLTGLALIRVGWRGRRINRDPVCRDCGFNLRAFRLPEMHRVSSPVIAAAAVGETIAETENGQTHSLTLGARGDESETLDGARGPAATELPITVTCPECGGGLTRAKAVRIGERKRMPIVSVLGLLLVVGPVVGVVPLVFAVLSGKGAVSKLPLGIVLFLATGSDSTIATELESRLLSSKLAKDEIEAVIAKTVQLQGDWSSEWSPKWGDVYEAAATLGPIPPPLMEAWERQSMTFRIIPRAEVNSGDPLPIRVLIGRTRINPTGMADIEAKLSKVTVAGVACAFDESGDNRSSIAYLTASGPKSTRGGGDQSLAIVRTPTGIPIGDVEVQVTFHAGRRSPSGKGDPQARVLTAAANVRVLNPESPSVAAKSPDDLTREAVRRFLSMEKVVLAIQGWRKAGASPYVPMQAALELELWNRTEPGVALAMSIWLIDAQGAQYRIGSVQTSVWGFDLQTQRMIRIEGSSREIPKINGGVVSIVFKPDVEIAKRSTVTREFFGEEIRFDNLPLVYKAYLAGKENQFSTLQELVDAYNNRNTK